MGKALREKTRPHKMRLSKCGARWNFNRKETMKNLADMTHGKIPAGSSAVLARASDDGIAVGTVAGHQGSIVLIYGPAKGAPRRTRGGLGLAAGIEAALVFDCDGAVVGVIAPRPGANGEQELISAYRSLAVKAERKPAQLAP